ncbi:hypothetical protein DSAG12_02620 [Promethearchaeum syntrophicum]|uniref:Zinc-ribbon domain-containing protein n=1 Tax=Promethearchaeum syntrophicum TaxID=2594042 RepID=A0A5B9DDD8_9ARCH|nr:hypothetical protein [Candidatus Prometheoarchaeum syntrophicum]QEE16790.1 hypothetical protein DSAG12_02620 [Candidatus Prometheoarchaeum syntrophicum]
MNSSYTITYLDISLITLLGLLIVTNLIITKYSKSWLESYSNLSHWNDFFSNYEIITKKKELSLLERDFQEFESENSKQGIKCPICGRYHNSFSNYCDNCGNELFNRKDEQ